MALAGSGTALRVAIVAAIEAETGQTLPQASRDVWQAFGEAVVAHVVANTQVAVISVTGVLPGILTSGPGTGTLL